MKVRKHNFVVQVAYFGRVRASIPARTDLCTLIRRFVLLLPVWFILSIVIWIAFGFVLGLLGHPIRVVCVFLFGYRVRWDPSRRGLDEFVDEGATPGGRLLLRLTTLTYKNVKMTTPIIRHVGPTILIAAVTWLALTIVLEIARTVGQLAHLASEGSLPGWLQAVGLAVVALAALVLAYRSFARSETGQLVAAYVRAKKEKVCPIVDVV
jgi:hypothetical protein